MPNHPCFSSFWGDSAQDLFDILASEHVGFGDVRNMSFGTYMTMCNVQRAIEWAVGIPEGYIPSHLGIGTDFPPQDEALLRMTGCTFLNDLTLDSVDPSPPPPPPPVSHTAGLPFGWLTTGEHQVLPVDAMNALYRPGLAAPPAAGVVDNLLGRVKNSLGST